MTTRTNGFPPQVSVRSAGKPASTFPGAVAGDAQLAIAVDRNQTALAGPLGATDTSMSVQNIAGIAIWSLLSIDNEIVQVNNPPSGNTVPIRRGFDGTTPAAHQSGATVAGLIDAYHHNTLVAEVEAIEQALGANLANVAQGINAAAYNFSPQSPSGALIVGNNAITMSPVPAGVNGSDTGHALYVAGTGTPEVVQVTGGSGVAGQPSGQIIINCANPHPAGWTIASASGGLQEAICALPAAGGSVQVTQSLTLLANVTNCGKTDVEVYKQAGATISGAFTILGASLTGILGPARTGNHAETVQQNLIVGGPSFWADIRAYGAVCDGTANDTAAFQAAVNAAAVTGGTVFIPTGTVKLTPDTVTIPGNVNVIGQGQGNSVLIPSASGTTLLKVTGTAGNYPNNPVLRDFKIDLTAFPALNGMDLTLLNNANFERISINLGTYGIRLMSNVSQTHLRNLRIYDQTNTGLYVNGDSCAELFYDDIDIAKTVTGTMQYGLQIARSTTADVGAHYMKRVRVLGYYSGNCFVTTAMAVATNTTADTGTIIMAEQLVLEQISGACLSLQKASVVFITGSWFASEGVSNAPTIQFDGSDNISIMNSTIYNAGATAPVFAFVDGSPNRVPTTLIRIVGNRLVANGGVIFSVVSTNPPQGLVYQANSGITNNANLTNDLPTLQGATNQYSSKLCATNVGSAYITTGFGTPIGSVQGNPGDLYLNMSGGAATTLYVKESGTGTTAGWVGK